MTNIARAVDAHVWTEGEIATGALLRQLPLGYLASASTDADITGIGGAVTVCKVGGGTGPDIVYGDSRILKVSAYGRTLPGDATYITTKILWSGSLLVYHTQTVVGEGADYGVSLFGIILPGAPGTGSATVTVERAGTALVTARAGFRVLVEDIGSSENLIS